jgi:NAD(P) transhydrogenase subunit alpha
MIVGAVKETFPGERRVALTPQAMRPLLAAGVEFLVESGAGVAAGFPDAEFSSKGARVVAERAEVFALADVLLQVRGLGANPDRGQDDLPHLRQGQVLLAMFEPLTALEQVKQVADRGVTLFAMELIPRITRAQSMDVLSSMATVAGYKAVLLAAGSLPKMFPMLMTAAGTIKPARVFVVGVGVAGLQAIATARRLGSMVEAYDVRPAVKEQVESLGAKFVELGLEQAEGAGGYAKEMGEKFYARQREVMTRVVGDADVVITTAAVPGKKAPVLVTAEMVAGMRPGSLIVDLAAERGGNCALTRPGETVIEGGVTIHGPINLAATVPFDASQMYAKNLATLLQLMVKDGKLTLDLSDDVIRETLVTHGGEITHAGVREALGLTAVAAARPVGNQVPGSQS